MMKRSLLDRLRRNGSYYLVSALLLLVGVPLYQFLVLVPTGFSNALTGSSSAYFIWISSNSLAFIGYRLLLILAFALLFTLPFSLFRIIITQEIMGQIESEEAEEGVEPTDEAAGKAESTDLAEEEEAAEENETAEEDSDAVVANAWRGKGFAIIGAWAGVGGLLLYVLGTLVSTLYLGILGSAASSNTASILEFATNTVGIGLLALSTLFFGAIIARGGRNLWPGAWVAFGWLAIALTAFLSASAFAIANTPTAGQSPITTPAILLFAIWVLWLGIMLVRLKPEE